MQAFGLARLGRDAELKYTQDGTAVASLALAFDYGRKVDGKKPTQWVNGSLWGKLAESLAPYLLKGTQVVVTLDDLHIREYESNGKSGHALEGRVSSITLAGSPKQQEQKPERKPAPRQEAPVNFDDFDDDIPF